MNIKNMTILITRAMTTQAMYSGADKLEVQMRDTCAQHASQVQQ
jgi:hypothetical protein